MKITRAAENAVHAMIRIASSCAEVSLASEVARNLNIKPAYLSKILQELVRAGLLVSRQGRGGGFALALPPGRITLRMIVEAVEGQTAINRCLLRKGQCSRSKRCGLHRALAQAQKRLLDVFERWTIADLMRPSAQTQGRPVAGTIVN